jgi:hypothetical protein
MLTSLCVLLCSAFWLSWLAAGSPRNTKLTSSQDSALGNAQVEVRTKTKAKNSVDACSLLTGVEIAAVLGEPLQELKPTSQATGNINMSQCLFVTRNFAKSASLAVATPSIEDSGARSLRAFWRNQFHPLKPEEKRRPAPRKTPAKSAFSSPREALKSEVVPYRQSDDESGSEAEDDARKPQPISALGEEAYWVGGPISGALYVLQGDLFLRISVGGIPQESIRIAKSKSLASAILSRLRHNPL